MSGDPAGRVRIISGEKRGRRIVVPAGRGIRPTSDMVREAVFDVLGSVRGLDVLDLFAGTGALGIEALSRGAKSCVFVDADPEVAKVVGENLTSLEYERVGRVINKDYQKATEAMCAAGERADLLFVDPPYKMLAEVETALAPRLGALLSPRGLVVVEGPSTANVTFGQGPIFERQYGDTRIIMVRVKE